MKVQARSLEEWAEVSSKGVIPVKVDTADPSRVELPAVKDNKFKASIEALTLGPDLAVSRLVSDVCIVSRSDRLVRTDPANVQLFGFHFRGSGVLEQGGRQARLDSGSGMLCSAATPYRLDYVEPSDKSIIQLAPGFFDKSTFDALALRPIPAEQPSLRLLRGFVEQVLSVGEELGADERVRMGAITGDLIRAAVRSILDDRPVAPTGREALLRLMQSDIADRLGDPDLSPTDLAARHHISLRYVHSLFGDADTSPAAYIRERRLQAAYQWLGDPRRDSATVTALAYELGFGDITSFVRAFRRRFGATPSEVRSARSA